MPKAAAFPEVEIFRAGRHTAVDGTEVDVTPADLAAIADAYDPALGEAPHVVGHPQLNAPAYGWVKKLAARDGVLFAAVNDQVDPAFADLVSKGRFKKRSASFFRADSPGNPKPGGMYLRHVGWLGAAAPAVTGLRDVQFGAADDGVVEFAIGDRYWAFGQIANVFRRVRDYFVETQGADKADLLLPSWSIDSIAEAARPDTLAQDAAHPSFAAPPAVPSQPEIAMSEQNTADFAARETALNDRQQNLDQREKALRDKENQARRIGVVEFAAGLVKAGRLLPRQEAPVVELLVSLENAEQPATLSFAAADGSQQTVQAGAALRALLAELPVQVDFAERGAGRADDELTTDFAAPRETQVDRTRLELHTKALAWQRQNPNTSYVDAVRAVGG